MVSGSPADRAGITAGDVITGFDGTTVTTATGLSALLDKTHGGDRVSVTWTGSTGTSQHATVTLAVGPAS